MTDKKDAPKFSEKKVDDLIAAHGREPSKHEMGMVEAMIETQRVKMKVRQQLKEAKEAKKIKQGKGRKM